MTARNVLATAAIILIVLYVLVDIVLQFLPPHYSAVTDAESDLAVGPFGWAMRVNFGARAVMSGCVVAAIALSPARSALRTVGSVLVGAAGLCSFALVFFPTDVNRVGEFGMSPRSAIGTTHVVFATVGFVAILLGMLLLTPWVKTTLRARAATVFIVIAVAGLVLLALSLLLLPQVVGLTERLCLAGILGWAFVICGRLRPRPRSAIAATPRRTARS